MADFFAYWRTGATQPSFTFGHFEQDTFWAEFF